MCGIAGLWSRSFNNNDLEIEVKKMASAINHRGPDHSGFWQDSSNSLYISHQRLSILDLSIAGNQPMFSHSGRYVISFNGEIYNFRQLKEELVKTRENIRWRGSSDTEVLLELVEAYGLEAALNKCVGMFALAIWDRREKVLQLARDRTGEKPLYYGFSGSCSERVFLFASELSSICAYKKFNNSINLIALSELFRYQAISSPNSIYQGIYQLLPGHLLTLDSPNEDNLNDSESWWDFTSVISNSLNNQFSNKEEAEFNLEKTLKEAVKLQSVSDVPLGTFLSGGIDSSLITALLQSESIEKVKTFTIGFEESEYNEAPFSKAISEHLGTDHVETYLTLNDAQNLIPSLSSIYSEPFADSSQLPTHLVCKEARTSGLTVALTGDGGDELFGGYNRYFLGEKIWQKMNLIPFPIRKIMGISALNIPFNQINRFSNVLGVNLLGTKIHKLADRLIYVRNRDDFYYSLLSQWNDPNFLFRDEIRNENLNNLPSTLSLTLPVDISDDLKSRMMAYDTLNYLPNDILCKVDRASMAASLETRAPFLDHRVIETAWQIPMAYKINNNSNIYTTKFLLREILYKYVPRNLIERPKAGFAIPIAKWLRGGLKPWAQDLISEEMLAKQSILNPKSINKLWEDHLSEKVDNSSKLWPILMWQSWIDTH